MTSLQDKIAALKAGYYDVVLDGTPYSGCTKGRWEWHKEYCYLTSDVPKHDDEREYYPKIVESDGGFYGPKGVDIKVIADSKQNAAKVIVLEEQVRVLREALKASEANMRKVIGWHSRIENGELVTEGFYGCLCADTRELMLDALAATDMWE